MEVNTKMNNKKRKIISIVGARPNFVKIAPVVKLLQKYKDINSLLIHTGQHYDREMSKVFFEDLDLPKPDIYLNVGSHSQASQTAKIMIGLERVLVQERPDLVIVVGDVNSTLAGALVASKLSIPIAHIEAGLRSFDMSMPEEINRILTDSVSEFLFTPSKDANNNLYREGIRKNKIYFVGNVMIDSLMKFKRTILKNDKLLNKLGIAKKDYSVLTMHRPSNVDNLKDLKKIVKSLSVIQKKIKILFPIHPRTKFFIKNFGLSKKLSAMKNVHMIDPLGYLDFLSLMNNSLFVMTDSGGIQEETTVLGIPCLTVRENTERPVTVKEGTNVIVGTNPARIIKESLKILDGNTKNGRVPELWDGKTAERIVKIILN